LSSSFSSSSSIIPSNAYILGDAGYPCQDWLITPYRDNGRLTQKQTYYNVKHSQTHISIKQVFGKLKSRFRCLLINPIATLLETVILIITSSCILHNICEERQEDMLDDDEYFDDQNHFQTLSNNNRTYEVTNSVRDNFFFF